MPKSVRDEIWSYDLFISYSHHDEFLSPFIDKLVHRIRATFRELTGLDARIFVDHSAVSNAMLWKQRIETALAASAAFIVVESTSYYTSEWCQKELDAFLIHDSQRKSYYQLLPYESLIFPVRRIGLDPDLQASPDQRRRIQELSQRQHTDLTDIEVGTLEFDERVDRLVVDIASVLQKLMQPDFTSVQQNAAAIADLPVTTPLVTTYSGVDSRKLLQLFCDAQSVTVVGITNEGLADVIEAAIKERRRRNAGRYFWDNLHIVFLASELLPLVPYGLSAEFPDKPSALNERARRVNSSKRQLTSLLLREGLPGRWMVSSYGYAPPLFGILFSMPDGKRIIQIHMMHPSRLEADRLNIEFVDRADEYFELAFRDIVETSTDDHEIVLTGSPGIERGSFIYRGSRFRRSVLVEGKNISDWLAAVIIVTWRIGRNGPEPLLQIRNSSRETGKASHPSGYLNLRDYQAASDNEPGVQESREPVVSHATVSASVRRELMDQFGIAAGPSPAAMLDSANFYYPDKENMFFYVLKQEIGSTFQFAADTQMFPWTVSELLEVRRHQVYLNAHAALSGELTARQRAKVAKLIALNLTAHGDIELAEQVEDWAQGTSAAGLASRLAAGIESTRIYKYRLGRELQVVGIAGLQYRTFFKIQMAAYKSIGVAGAAEELAAIEADSRRADAVELMAELYEDEGFITSFPMEV